MRLQVTGQNLRAELMSMRPEMPMRPKKYTKFLGLSNGYSKDPQILRVSIPNGYSKDRQILRVPTALF